MKETTGVALDQDGNVGFINSFHKCAPNGIFRGYKVDGSRFTSRKPIFLSPEKAIRETIIQRTTGQVR
jgi:hypothetical protein